MATAFCCIGILVFLVLALDFKSIILGIVGVLASWLGSLFMYGFGELIDLNRKTLALLEKLHPDVAQSLAQEELAALAPRTEPVATPQPGIDPAQAPTEVNSKNLSDMLYGDD